MSGPVLGRQDILHRIARKSRKISKRRIRQQQIFRIFQHTVVFCQIKIVRRNAGQQLPCFLHIIGDDHKLHRRVDPAHLLHTHKPVFFPQKKLRRTHIVTAPQMQDAQIVPAVFLTVVLRPDRQPLFDLFFMGNKIILCLQVPVEQRIVLHRKQRLVGVRDIDAMRQVVSGVARKKSRLLLLKDFLIILLLRRDAHIQIHKVQPAVTVHVIGKMLRIQHAECIPFIQRNASGRNIEEQLIAQPEAFLCLNSQHPDSPFILSPDAQTGPLNSTRLHLRHCNFVSTIFSPSTL